MSLLSKERRLNPWILGLMVAGVLGVLGLASTDYFETHSSASRQEEIAAQAVPVQVQDLTVKIQANGVVQAVRKVNLSPEDAGRLVQLYFSEGDRVVQGQIIARLSSSRLEAQINRFSAILTRAEADLQQKRAGNRPEEIAQGTARVAEAEADLERLRYSLPPEIERVQAQLAAAHARRELAEIRRSRYLELEKEGAIALDRLNEVETDYKTAKADEEAIQRRIAQLKVNQQLEIAKQKAVVAQAREALRLLRKGPRLEEITQAEAEVAQARAQLAFYQTQLNDTVLRAPFDGVITRRFAQVGDFITPTTPASGGEGATAISIAELSSGLEIEVKIPEAKISKIHLYQPVNIQVDAYPNELFQGRVSLIAPRAVQENNITFFRVKVGLETGQAQLKSGMNVRLEMLSAPIQNALTIPLAAVVTQPDGQTGVYVPDEQAQSRFVPIRVGITSGDRLQVIAGLQAGDLVFISPPSDQKIEGIDSVNLGY